MRESNELFMEQVSRIFDQWCIYGVAPIKRGEIMPLCKNCRSLAQNHNTKTQQLKCSRCGGKIKPEEMWGLASKFKKIIQAQFE